MDIINNFIIWRSFSYIKKMKLRKFNFYIILVIFLFIFVTLLLGLNKNNTYTTEQILDKKIINFESIDLITEKKISFFNILGDEKYTILNIWASWCLPCKSEHRHLIEIKKNTNANLIGINYKDKDVKAKSFLRELGNPYHHSIVDYNGLISIDLGAYGVPETFIIDNKSRKIIKKYIGPLDKENLKEIVKLLEL